VRNQRSPVPARCDITAPSLPINAGGRLPLLLVSPLLSAAIRAFLTRSPRPCTNGYPSLPAAHERIRARHRPAPAVVLVRRPSPSGLTAAALFAAGKVLKGRLHVMYVNQALSPVLVVLRSQPSLDAVPQAYHNPAAVWWGAFAASVVIRDQVVIVKPVLVFSAQQRPWQWTLVGGG
jgi:hypothetical protein